MDFWLPLFAFAPFVSALIAPRVARALGGGAGVALALVPAGIFAGLLALLPTVAAGGTVTADYAWIPSLGIRMSFHLDGLSLAFALLISGIGTLITLYAGSYLAGHPHLGRFYLFLHFFMGAMLGVVLAGNLLALFVFWELTSLSSYLLIGFDHSKPESRASALQALLVTGAGGLALLAGLLLLGQAAGTYDYAGLLNAGPDVVGHALYVPIVLLVLLGACTKSAQFPFHFWLPNAMAAPAPVSAYLHSSTMVKAGVYLLARLNPVLGGTGFWQGALMTIGTLTMAVAALLALRQTKMKPLLAYTTVSALGMLVAFIGVDTPLAAKGFLVFLVVHALYKAGMFMVAGALEHETGEKDAEALGGLARAMPLTALGAGLAAVSMAGIPPTVGFIGKEVLYESGLAGLSAAALWAPWIFLAVLVGANVVNVHAAAMIALRPFLGRLRPTPKSPHEGGPGLWLGPVLLGLLGLALGIYPAAMATGLASAGATALHGAPITAKLSLWHGVNAALILSGCTLAGGAAVFLLRKPIRQVLGWFTPLDYFGPEAAYDRALATMIWSAKLQTRILQNGYLRMYVLTITLFLLALPGTVLALRTGIPSFQSNVPLDPFGLLICGGIVIGAVVVTRTQSRLTAIAALGISGIGMSLVYVLYGAPDLAMTQFVIEILTVILFVLVLYRMPPFTHFTSGAARVRDLVVAAFAGGFMTLLVLSAIEIDIAPRISNYHVQHSATLAHGRNIVNTILVDFRALDTLGELTVLAIAAVGAFGLLRLKPRRRNSP